MLQMVSAEQGDLRGMLEVNDIVAEVNRTPIRTLNDYFAEMEKLPASGDVELVVLDARTLYPHRWKAKAQRINIPANSQSAGNQLRKVHFLLIGLTGDRKIGGAMEDTIDLWRGLSDFVAEERLGTIREVTGDECTANQILEAVNEMHIAHRDSVFCLYCGHGANDPNRAPTNDPSRGHFFAIPSGDLMRHQLYSTLKAKNPRLCVLISDTCNVTQQAFPAIPMESKAYTMTVMGNTNFETLMLEHYGDVDISGADFGQYGYCRKDYGAFFSNSAVPVFNAHVDWRTAFDRARLKTNLDFQQLRIGSGIAQEQLTPVAFRLDVYREQTYAMAPDRQRTITRTVRLPDAGIVP